MIQTNTEYMSDKARAERVVRRFMDMTLSELAAAQNSKCIEIITEEMIPREGFSEEEIQDITYLEFVRLINGVGGNSDYDWYDHDSYAEQLTYYKMLTRALLDAGKVSIPVRLFMALPLKAFYTCLNSLSNRNALLKQFEGIKSSCHCSDNCTIEDFLSAEIYEGNKVWVTIMPIDDYKEQMKAAHIHMGNVLVDSFCTAFPGSMQKFSRQKRGPDVIWKRSRQGEQTTAEKQWQ